MGAAEIYWQDERATIWLGDALEVLPRLEGIGAVITDPPYSSGGAFRGDRAASTVSKYVHSGTTIFRPEFSGDNRDQRSFLAWSSLWLAAARTASVPGAPVCVFTDWRQLPTTTDAVQAGGWSWRGVAVWGKKFGRAVGTGRFSSAAEFVVWGSNGPIPSDRPGVSCGFAWSEEDATPIEVASPPTGAAKRHIAEKPERIMRWLCSIAPAGSVVLDPFLGSGSTGRAALDMGLRFVGIECDAASCEIARRRLTEAAVLEGLNDSGGGPELRQAELFGGGDE